MSGEKQFETLPVLRGAINTAIVPKSYGWLSLIEEQSVKTGENVFKIIVDYCNDGGNTAVSPFGAVKAYMKSKGIVGKDQTYKDVLKQFREVMCGEEGRKESRSNAENAMAAILASGAVFGGKKESRTGRFIDVRFEMPPNKRKERGNSVASVKRDIMDELLGNPERLRELLEMAEEQQAKTVDIG